LNLNRYLEFASRAEPVPLRAIQSPNNPVRNETGDLTELISSIRSVGLIHPILIRPIRNDKFEVVAGMRRYEAGKILHWSQISAIVREMNAEQAYEIALTENIQRKSMNPMEEARAFQIYVGRAGWGGISRLADKLGKSKSYVSQRILLLSLPPSIQNQLSSGQLSPSLARELACLDDVEAQETMANEACNLKLSTRSTKQMLQFKSKTADFASPEFTNYSSTRENETSIRTLQQAILAMKLTLARLDILKEKCNGDVETSKYLQELRLHIHEMISADNHDNAVRYRTNYDHNPDQYGACDDGDNNDNEDSYRIKHDPNSDSHRAN